MKSRATLTLMELLVMLLVFALAAAMCLQVFASADRISDESARLDLAVTHAQSVAEVLKACDGDFEKLCASLGGEWDGKSWTVRGEDYTLHASPAQGGHSLTGQAQIFVRTTENENLYSLTVAWQKGGSPNEE